MITKKPISRIPPIRTETGILTFIVTSPAVLWISLFLVLYTMISGCESMDEDEQALQLSDRGYFEARGINYLVFNNWYSGMFSDSKMSGVEIIHHGERISTNGDVRLEPTPEQWDAIPTFRERIVDTLNQTIEARLSYPAEQFSYAIVAEAFGSSLKLRVVLDEPLPASLEGRAGLNMEFLPSAFFRHTYVMNGSWMVLPLYPSGPMKTGLNGELQPLPMATGSTLVLAPENPERRISIESAGVEMEFFDGRNMAQNGWFVVRSLIPPGRTGTVIEWTIHATTLPGWMRNPVIGHSQAGYHPAQKKVAVIELDKKSEALSPAILYRIDEDGSERVAMQSEPEMWGEYLRYRYVTFDFSEIREEGVYRIAYQEELTEPFLIDGSVLENGWQQTLDVFIPVQMDHMHVNETYRVWHGAAHLDDARQAPVNHNHFDLYGQGPTTDTPYPPGAHIPGLDVGGWCDAGDYDLRTQSQYATILGLVQVWEEFHIRRDQTTVDQANRYVDLRVPDGQPDVLQQIEHGTLALIAQFRAVGHAIPGIIVPDLSQYTHLGDAMTMTDNQVFDPSRPWMQPDDRWAFTSRSTALNYGSAAALAAASRALAEYNPSLASECLRWAEQVWREEQSHPPHTFRVGNTTGGNREFEELKAAVELLITTGREEYSAGIDSLFPVIERSFGSAGGMAVRVIPYKDESYRARLESLAAGYKQEIDSLFQRNPYGVPISTGGWAGSGRVIGFTVNNYYLHRAFPEIVTPEDVYRGLHYIYGCHPGSDISFVSGVGTVSKQVAYGFNRADFSFIAGGIVPGVLILPPDFPENKEDWPFLWGENEYVITVGPIYIFAVNAAHTLLNE